MFYISWTAIRVFSMRANLITHCDDVLQTKYFQHNFWQFKLPYLTNYKSCLYNFFKMY